MVVAAGAPAGAPAPRRKDAGPSPPADGAGHASASAATLARMQAAVGVLLAGIGEDVTREGLVDTPRRVAKAWLDMAARDARPLRCTRFTEPLVAAGPPGLVLVRDVAFAAVCERTLLPFHGRAHVAYVPAGGVVLGLSKLARLARALAARGATSQARLTRALLAAVAAEAAPSGAAVVLDAAHLGGGRPAARRTAAGAGALGGGPAAPLFAEVLDLLGLGGAPVRYLGDALGPGGGGGGGGEESDDEEGMEVEVEGAAADCAADAAMVAAVGVLLEGVGEDPRRPGLARGAARYVRWLRAATAGGRGCACAAGAAACAAPAEASDTSSDEGACCAFPPAAGAAGPAAPPPAAAADGAAPVHTFSAPFVSQCEHHLLPFHGAVKVAWRGGAAPGAAAAAALRAAVAAHAARLQVQERLTAQVAAAAEAALGGPAAVLVLVEGAHMCMVARGVEERASATATTAARGAWAAGPSPGRAAALRALLALPGGGGA